MFERATIEAALTLEAALQSDSKEYECFVQQDHRDDYYGAEFATLCDTLYGVKCALHVPHSDEPFSMWFVSDEPWSDAQVAKFEAWLALSRMPV